MEAIAHPMYPVLRLGKTIAGERRRRQADRAAQEKIFGPVISVTTFEKDDEAINIANGTLYGLGAGVWTRDGARAYRAGGRLFGN